MTESHDALVAALVDCKVALEMHIRTTDLADQCHSSFDLAAIEAANTVLSSVGAGNTTSVEHTAVAAQQQAQTAREEQPVQQVADLSFGPVIEGQTIGDKFGDRS